MKHGRQNLQKITSAKCVSAGKGTYIRKGGRIFHLKGTHLYAIKRPAVATTAGLKKRGPTPSCTKVSCDATSARVRCAPIACETCQTRAGKREGEHGAEKHEEIGSKHAKNARQNTPFSNAKMEVFPPSPADANRTVQKAVPRRTFLLLFAPPRGSIITHTGKNATKNAGRGRETRTRCSITVSFTLSPSPT